MSISQSSTEEFQYLDEIVIIEMTLVSSSQKLSVVVSFSLPWFPTTFAIDMRRVRASVTTAEEWGYTWNVA
jgi:hypothetical protein